MCLDLVYMQSAPQCSICPTVAANVRVLRTFHKILVTRSIQVWRQRKRQSSSHVSVDKNGTKLVALSCQNTACFIPSIETLEGDI